MRLRDVLMWMAVAAVVVGCSRVVPTSNDNTWQRSRLIIPDPAMPTTDRLDVAAGDSIDWKRVFPQFNGRVTLKFIIGNPFEDRNTIVGLIRVRDMDADAVVTPVRIVPNTLRYSVSWDARANAQYLVSIAATSGAGRYVIRYSQAVAPKKPVDPCASVTCGDEQRCEGGVCIDLPRKKPRVVVGKGCGKCKRGHYCSKRKKKCVKDRCYRKSCPSKHYCRGGKCYRKRSRPVKKPTVTKPKASKPSARLRASCLWKRSYKGGKTLVGFNRGRIHQVSRLDRASMGGKTVVIIKVFGGQSQGVVNAPPSDVKCKSATIRRRKFKG